MNEHTSSMLEFAAIVTPMFLACIAGIVAIYSRLASLETKIGPIWMWWNKNIERRSQQREK